MQNLAKKRQESYAKANNVPEECLSSMRTVRSFANEKAELQRFDLKLRHTLKIIKLKATIYGAWMSSNTVCRLALSLSLFPSLPLSLSLSLSLSLFQISFDLVRSVYDALQLHDCNVSLNLKKENSSKPHKHRAVTIKENWRDADIVVYVDPVRGNDNNVGTSDDPV